MRLPEDQWPQTNIATCPISVHVAALYAVVEEESKEFDAVLHAAASRGKWTHKLRVIAMLLIAVWQWRIVPKASPSRGSAGAARQSCAAATLWRGDGPVGGGKG